MSTCAITLASIFVTTGITPSSPVNVPVVHVIVHVSSGGLVNSTVTTAGAPSIGNAPADENPGVVSTAGTTVTTSAVPTTCLASERRIVKRS